MKWKHREVVSRRLLLRSAYIKCEIAHECATAMASTTRLASKRGHRCCSRLNDAPTINSRSPVVSW